jgi:hypothetical protein
MDGEYPCGIERSWNKEETMQRLLICLAVALAPLPASAHDDDYGYHHHCWWHNHRYYCRHHHMMYDDHYMMYGHHHHVMY